MSGRALAILGATATLACGGSNETVVVEAELDPPSSPPPFLERSVEAGIEFRHRRGSDGTFRLEEIMSGGVALFDADGDEDLDLFLVHGEASGGFRLYENAGDGRLTDRTARIEATASDHGMGCAAADYDGDGWTDLYLTCVGPDLLLQNGEGESFHDVTERVGLGDDGFGSSAAWFDADLDGDLDLYVARYIDRSSPENACRHVVTNERDYCNPTSYRPASDRLYRNDDGRFVDVSAASGVGSAAGYGLAVLCSDFDLDGAVDVFVANDQSPAFLWKNDGEGGFEDVAPALGLAYDRDGRAIAGMGLVSDDFDGDLDLDLFVTNIREQDNVFYRLEDGSFRDVSRRWGAGAWLWPFTGFGVACFDQDHDGLLDMYVANGAVAIPVERRGDDPYAEPDSFLRFDGERFVDAGAHHEADVARGVARGDVDGDGDVDLVVCRNGGEPRLLLNQAPAGRHWLVVSVLDERGRHLLNSRVELHAAGRTWLAEVRAQESYLSSRDPRVHFGLGDVDLVERVRVRFPDGRTRELHDVSADQVLVVRDEESR